MWANDIYPDAVATYRKNIGSHIVEKDIREISSNDIADCDAIVGGFPCQGFSVANWTRTVGDERNSLYREMVRVIRDKMPIFFVVENVKGIVSLGKGAVLKKIISDFQSTGYTTRWSILNCADYGVPQKRMRFVMLGIRNDIFTGDIIFPPKPSHCHPDKIIEGRLPWVAVGDALAHFPDPDTANSIPNHSYSRYKLTFNGHLGHRFIDPKAPAPTVTGRGDEKGGVVVLHHPGNHRRMSARELAAVQSFPDDFVFEGPRSSAYRQIANAVPPLLGYSIGLVLTQNELLLSTKR